MDADIDEHAPGDVVPGATHAPGDGATYLFDTMAR